MGAAQLGSRLAQLDRVDRGPRLSAAKRFRNAGLRAVIVGALWLADRLTERRLLTVGRFAGRALFRLLPTARATARANLTAVGLDSIDPRDVFERAGENLAWCLMLRRRDFDARRVVSIEDVTMAHLRRIAHRGRGVVFVSAHLGPFECLAAVVAAHGLPCSIVTRGAYDPSLDATFDQHRTSRGLDVIHRRETRAALAIVRALGAGRLVGLLPDLGGRIPSAPGTFLGLPALIPIGPQRIAIRRGGPLVVGTLRRVRAASTDGDVAPFTLDIEELPVEPETGEGSLGRAVCGALSRAIRRSPEDWLWMAPRFKLRPVSARG